MKKSYLLVLVLSIAFLLSWQESHAAYCTYSGNISSGMGRNFNSFTLTDGINSVAVSSIQPTTSSPVYVDKTASVLETTAGATLSFSAISWNGSWMHGYVFIDYNQDEVFNQDLNADGTNSGEVVSYSFYVEGSGDTGTNSRGVSVTSGNACPSTSTMPNFVLPATLAPGDYRLRFNVVWNTKDPCGYSAIQANGGCICDILIRIPGITPMPTITPKTGTHIKTGASKNAQLTSAGTTVVYYYTLDGTDPTTESQSTTTGIVAIPTETAGTVTLKAAAQADEYEISQIATATYNIVDNPAYCTINTNGQTGNFATVRTLSTTNLGDFNLSYTNPNQGNSANYYQQVDAATSNMRVAPGTAVTMSYLWGNAWWSGFSVFMDLNGDKNFDAATERIIHGNGLQSEQPEPKLPSENPTTASTTTVNISADAEYGTHLIRAVSVASDDACTNRQKVIDIEFMICPTVTTDAENCTVSGTTGLVPVNTTVTLTATPNTDYVFKEWQKNGIKIEGAEAEYITEAITGDVTYKAVCELRKYTMTASILPTASGSVTINGADSPVQVIKGGNVSFSATAASGYKFVNWTNTEGFEISSQNPYNTTAESDLTLVANFAEKSANDIAFTQTEVTVHKATQSTYTQTPTTSSTGAITYSSDNNLVATVDTSTGEVTIVNTGVAVITAQQVESADYLVGSASYTLSVMNSDEVKLQSTVAAEVTITVVMEVDGTVDANGVSVNVQANTPTTITTIADEKGEVALSSTAEITTLNCGENAKPENVPSTIKELELRNTEAAETEIPAGNSLEKLTLVVSSVGNAAAVATASSITTGVQLVVETEINTSRPTVNGTPTVFNFLSLPFTFNTAFIEYLDPTTLTWLPAVAETQVRIMTYNGQTRAEGTYSAVWDRVAAGSSINIAANSGFVVVGNNNIGGAAQDYKMKLRFTSSPAAYAQEPDAEKVVSASKWRKTSGNTDLRDRDWNMISVPFLTSMSNANISDYTIYTYAGGTGNDFNKNYQYYVPTDRFTLNPYQAFLIQAAPSTTGQSGDIVGVKFNPTQKPTAAVKAAGIISGRISVSIDGATPARLVIYDEASEDFVVNEDAWYMAPMNTIQPASYFVKGNSTAAVSVQPEVGINNLAVYTGAGTTHTISMPSLEGNYKVYLKDQVAAKEVCLNDVDYTFETTPKTTITDRFIITADKLTGISENISAGGIYAYSISGGIVVRGIAAGEDINIYNAEGVLLYTSVATSDAETIPVDGNGLYIIKTAGATLKVAK